MGIFSQLFGSGNSSAYDTSGLANAVGNSNDLYKQIMEQATAGGQSWLDLGKQGATALSGQLSDLTEPFSYDSFTADPSYQFIQDENAQAIERSAASRGSVLAPSTMKALQDRSTSLASTEYGNAFNRDLSSKSNIFDMLMGASGVGQNQAAQNAQYGTNYADAVSGNNIGLQNAILSAYGSKNANTQSMVGNWMNLAGSLGGAAMGGR